MQSGQMLAPILWAALAASLNSAYADDDKRLDRLDQRREQFKEAFVNADVAVLATLVAPHYTHTNDTSEPLSRDGWLNAMRKRQEDAATGDSSITQFDSKYFPVRIHGNTAIVTGTTTLRGERDEKEYGMRINFTHVWEWDGEEWYRVAFHDTYHRSSNEYEME